MLVGRLVVVVALGAFAPEVTTALSGAGRQADGSQSVQVGQLAEEHFAGHASSAVQVVVSVAWLDRVLPKISFSPG